MLQEQKIKKWPTSNKKKFREKCFLLQERNKLLPNFKSTIVF